jgi:hypothetical protein
MSRHIEFRIDAIGIRCRSAFHCVGGPRKHGSNIWNRISILYTIETVFTSGLAAAILDLTTANTATCVRLDTFMSAAREKNGSGL